jgi:hypothetical protein
MPVAFRVTYDRIADVQSDLGQMASGGFLVKVTDATGLALDTPARLELALPGGAVVAADVRVLQVLAGHGVAVTVDRKLVADLRERVVTAKDSPAGRAPRHERLDGAAPAPSRAPTAPPAPPPVPPAEEPDEPAASRPAAEKLTHAEKIHMALHGNREQRNAILRDPLRTLHPFVLKNPQISIDDIIAIAKNAQSAPDMLKLISDRKEWFQRPQVAVALARNPKTPGEVAIRALDHVPLDTLRQLAKGGALPHVVQAARKKVIK